MSQQHLTVSFADSTGRQRSDTSGSRPTPHDPEGSDTKRSKPILYPIEPSTKKKTFHLPLGSPLSPNGSLGSRSTSPSPEEVGNGNVDPERRPLLSPTASNRRRTAIPIIVGFFMIVIGLVVGGYALGQGAGGDRWPGGPH